MATMLDNGRDDMFLSPWKVLLRYDSWVNH